MDTEYAEQAVNVQETATTSIVEGSLMLEGRNTPNVSRARLKELFALAYETVQWLESKGLKKGEQCEFREIAERLWWKE